jgi:hypothetical protein
MLALASAADPAADKRAAKQLIVPVFSLAVGLRDLFNDLQSNAWGQLPRDEQQELVRQFHLFGERVPTTTGSLKTARDKIGAHLDKDVFAQGPRQVWEQFDLRDLLGWIYGCVEMLRPLLEADVYAWTRDSGRPQVVSLMTVDGTEVDLLLEDGEPTMIVGVTLTDSPRRGIFREVCEVTGAWMRIASRLGPPPQLPTPSS